MQPTTPRTIWWFEISPYPRCGLYSKSLPKVTMSSIFQQPSAIHPKRVSEWVGFNVPVNKFSSSLQKFTQIIGLKSKFLRRKLRILIFYESLPLAVNMQYRLRRCCFYQTICPTSSDRHRHNRRRSLVPAPSSASAADTNTGTQQTTSVSSRFWLLANVNVNLVLTLTCFCIYCEVLFFV